MPALSRLPRPSRLPLVALALVVATASVTACSASGQSRTDACIVVAQSLEAVQQDIADANTALAAGDLDALGESLTAAADSLGERAGEVTNAEVGPIMTALRTSIESVRDAVAEASASDDPEAATEAFAASGGDLQDAAVRFSQTCGG